MILALALSLIVTAFWILLSVVPAIEEEPLREMIDRWIARHESKKEFLSMRKPQRRANILIAAFAQRRAA